VGVCGGGGGHEPGMVHFWVCVCGQEQGGCVPECDSVLMSEILCYWVWLCATECDSVLMSVILCYWVWFCATECNPVVYLWATGWGVLFVVGNAWAWNDGAKKNVRASWKWLNCELQVWSGNYRHAKFWTLSVRWNVRFHTEEELCFVQVYGVDLGLKHKMK